MKVRAFITHKKAESYSDCQDRFSINPEKRFLAVSDGMSQSIFQTMWAQMLVEAYTQGNWVPESPSEDKYLEELSLKWREKVQERIQKQREEGNERAADRNERSLVEGRSAGATLAVIHFTEGTKWEGSVLGDSCIIEVAPKNYDIVNIYTSQSGENFDSYPDYYDSNPAHRGKGNLKSINGSLSENCCLLIVSDPLSDLLRTKRGTDEAKDLLKELLKVNNHDEFSQMVDSWRERHQMHNDDTTLLIIEIDNSEKLNIEHKDDIEALMGGVKTPSSSLIKSIDGVIRSQQDSSDSISMPDEENIKSELISKITPILQNFLKSSGSEYPSLQKHKRKKKQKKNKTSLKEVKCAQKIIEFILENYQIKSKDEQPSEHNRVR